MDEFGRILKADIGNALNIGQTGDVEKVERFIESTGLDPR